jgi:DinB superfamily
MRSLHLCRKSEPPPRILESKTAVMDTIDSLRQQLVNLLTKAEAHVDVASTLKDFPPPLRGRKPEGAPHTPWQLLEHMRLAQWDILHFSVDAKHVSPKWPEGYWPKRDTPANDKAWKESVQQFLGDLDDICDLVRDKKRDLFAPMPHGDGQTLLREVLLVADHNSYHLGQLVMVRKTLEG